MAVAQESLMTADELLMRPDDGLRHELIKGELRSMAPAGSEHGIVAMRIALTLGVHVEKHGLGAIFAAETGFRIGSNPDTVRAPDVAFISKERYEQVGPTAKFWPGPPDLAVEVLSPSDTYSEVQDKVFDWLEAGTGMVIVADPRKRVVTVYRSLAEIRVLTERGTLEGGNVVPGWSLAVKDIFI
jgi:Uma2 family endonuclease